MRKHAQNLGSEAGGGCEGAKKTAIWVAIGLMVLFFATAQVEAGGGAGSGVNVTDSIDGGGAGSGFDLYDRIDGGGAGSGFDHDLVDGGGAGSG